MNRLMRVLMFIYSVFIAVLSIILLYAFIDDGIFSRILSPLASLVTNPATKFGYLAILLVLLITAILAISNLILTGRLYRTKLRKTDIGSVDIGADAIESIALNSASRAQRPGLHPQRTEPSRSISVQSFTQTLRSPHPCQRCRIR